uniref:BTB domain-containing protein n=1 Tax=Mycena chlorophos TaxID=658473 RepID=A0ABQ0M0A2_MYCCL|nr:predicted protein [Mycena chlorophos]
MSLPASDTMPVDETPQRVESLWFARGTVVIRATEGPKPRLFKVFGDQLADRVPLFAELLSLPQPAGSETLEGCPVVDLPDLPEDVEVLLGSIFNLSFIHPFKNESTHISRICAILRMSHKYHVPSLFNCAIQLLETFFYASNFDGFLHRLAPHRINIPCGCESAREPRACLCCVRYPACGYFWDLMNAVERVEATWLLPVMRYFMCQVDVFNLGIRFVDKVFGRKLGDDFEWYHDGVTGLTSRFWENLGQLSESDALSGCRSNPPCDHDQFSRKLLKVGVKLQGETRQALRVLGDKKLGLCSECVLRVQKAHRQLVEKVWQDLPVLMGFYEGGNTVLGRFGAAPEDRS